MPFPKHILVVEDEALIALDVETTLVDLGHQVTTAATVAEATRAFEAFPIDLAILDYRLHDGTTAGLAAQLHDKNIPFIICSGAPAVAELGQAFQGAAFLPKPFTDEALRDAVAAADSLPA